MTGKTDSFQQLAWGDSPAPTAPPEDLPSDPGASYVPPEDTPATLPPTSASDAKGGDLATWATIVEGAPGRASSVDAETAPTATFRFVRRIGQGGCGEVWEAVQESLGRIIAVKRLRQDIYCEDEDETDFSKALESEFRLEALTTARLEHPNIVPVHDFGQDEAGRPLLAMKLVRGKPWGEIMAADEHLPVPEFLAKHLAILVDVAQAIAFSHSKAIIHRDLKPSQVMVGKFGEVVLMDWGLAVKTLDIPDVESGESTAVPTSYVSSLQTARNPAGTPSYMAPEQTLDTPKHLGAQTDIFLLGGILYRILTLSPPYDAATAEECFAMARLGDVMPPKKRAPDREIPRQLANHAMACLQAHPQDRLRNAQEFIEGIQVYLSGAGKRDEARKLIGQVEEMLDSHTRDYRILSRAHHLLERARGLWPENKDIFDLRDQVLQEYARAAVDTGDLVLARLQAEQVRREEDRKPLLGRIDAHEQRQKAHARQRKVFAIVLSVTLLCAAFLTWKDMHDRREKAAELESQNQLLMRQRNTGWDMMEFLLNDLRQDLETVGRLDVMEAMAEKSVGWFDSLPEEQLKGGVLRQRSLAWANLGDVRLGLGDTAGAIESFREARQAASQLVVDQPENGPYLDDLADRKVRLGLAHLAGGSSGVALEEIEGAVAIQRDRLGSSNDEALRLSLIRGLGAQGRALFAAGRPVSAVEVLDQAMALADTVPGDEKDAGMRSATADLLADRASVALAAGQADTALRDANAAWELRNELLAERPGDVSRIRALAAAGRSRGRALLLRGDVVEAPRILAMARDRLRDLSERLPGDVRLRVELADALVGIAEADQRLGRHERARANLATALSHVDQALSTRDSDALHLHRLRIRGRIGNTEWHAGDDAAAMRIWQEALAEAQSLDPGEALATDRASLVFDLESAIALVAAMSGDCGASRIMAVRTREEVASIVEGSPELKRFFVDPLLRSHAADAICSGEWQPLLDAIDELPSDGRTDTVLLFQAVAYANTGNPDGASALAEALRARHADDPLLDTVSTED